jgi:Tol biopolymer transport system component
MCSPGPTAASDEPLIAYSSIDASYRSQVFVMSPDGNARRAITSGPGDNTQPAWSPDGRLIAFATWREPASSVYIMASDGSCPRRVADGDSPAWSRDGRFIATRVINGPQQVEITDVASGTHRVLPAPGGQDVITRMAWEPDGSSLLVGGELGIARIAVDDGRVVTWLVKGLAASPSLSPDGRQVAYAAGTENFGSIVLVGADGSNERAIVSTLFGSDPTWTADGKDLLFSGPVPLQAETGEEFHIYRFGPDGTVDLGGTGEYAKSPSWRPTP